ncbi:listerin E3 ubiquitin protein ligase 1 [Gonapodya sp. JEL0774]|nr:listerin E3 ubiquitin protein ligase 1 [Gonapodya sp. JEL0774]
MGKNNPKASRPKSNVTPASSSRAADVLATQSLSSAAPGSFGFAFGSSPSSLGFSNNAPELAIESLVDGDLKFILRRLVKRDPLTRGKAADELSQYLARTETPEVVQALLPVWAGLYPRLAGDADRRVRELVGVAHLEVIRKAGRGVAPYLRDLAGAWVAATFDPAREVARVAQNALQTAFPSKRQDFLLFVHADLLVHARRALIEDTPESLSDPRFTSKEDMDSRYARNLTASLQTLTSLIDTLPLAERTKHQSIYDALFDESKVWAMANNSDAMVRRAAYTFVVTLCRRWEAALSSRLKIVCTAIPYRVFSDKDPSCHREMWEAVLVLTQAFPSVWLLPPKPTLPKLLSFLRTSASLSPQSTYPSLLPLLSLLPLGSTSSVVSGAAMFEEVITAAWEGTRTADAEAAVVGGNAVAECVDIMVSRSSEADATECVKRFLESRFGAMVMAALAQGTTGGIGKAKGEQAAGCVGKVMESLWASQVEAPVLHFLLAKVQATLCYHLRLPSGSDAQPFGVPPEGLVFPAACANGKELLAVLAKVAATIKGSEQGREHADAIKEVVADSVAAMVEALSGDVHLCDPLASALAQLCSNADVRRVLPHPRIRSSIAVLAVSTLPNIIPTVPQSVAESALSAVLDVWNVTNIDSQDWHALINGLIRVGTEFEKSVGLLTLVFNYLRHRQLHFDVHNDNLDQFLLRVVVEEIGNQRWTSQTHVVEQMEHLIAAAVGSSGGEDMTLLAWDVRFVVEEVKKICDCMAGALAACTSSLLNVINPQDHLVHLQAIRAAVSFTNIVDKICRERDNKNDRRAWGGIPELAGLSIITEIFELSQFGTMYIEDSLVQVRIADVGMLGSNEQATFAVGESGTRELDVFEELVANLTSNSAEVWDRATGVFNRITEQQQPLVECLVSRWHANVLDLSHIGSPAQFVDQLRRMREIPALSSALRTHVLSISEFSDETWTNALQPHSTSLKMQELAIVDDPLVVPVEYADNQNAEFVSTRNTHKRDLRGLSSYGRLGATLVGMLRLFGTEDVFATGRRLDTSPDKTSTGVKDFILLRLTELHRTVEDCKLGVVDPLFSPEDLKQEPAPQDNQGLGRFGWNKFMVDLCTVMSEVLNAVWIDSNTTDLREFLQARSYLQASGGEQAVLALYRKALSSEPDSKGWHQRLVARGAADALVSVFERATFDSTEREKWQRMLRNRKFVDNTQKLAEDQLADSLMGVSSVVLNQSGSLEHLALLVLSKNPTVQKTSTILLQRLIRDSVQVNSLKIEMRQSRQKASIESSEGLLSGEMDEDTDPEKIPSVFLEATRRAPAIRFTVDDYAEVLASTQWRLHLSYFYETNWRLQVDSANVLGYLLNWLLILEHFEGAVRIYRRFVVSLNTGRLSADAGRSGEFDPSKWQIQTVDLVELDTDTSLAFSLLASHLYWRSLKSLPSLVRMWWLDLRNRQTSQTIETYTENYFTPSIVSQELEFASDVDKLQLEKLNIKVLKTSSEIQATYEVEDNAILGVTVKFLSSFPLKQCEIDGTGGARVGVSESRWRAWLLGLSSVMLIQNGNILDAIATWHKNVVLHYEGIEDCTIW